MKNAQKNKRIKTKIIRKYNKIEIFKNLKKKKK